MKGGGAQPEQAGMVSVLRPCQRAMAASSLVGSGKNVPSRCPGWPTVAVQPKTPPSGEKAHSFLAAGQASRLGAGISPASARWPMPWNRGRWKRRSTGYASASST